MLAAVLDVLRHWSAFDTKVALTAVLAAMSCTLPGIWLVLRRYSMMGDALSHTVLPGLVGAFLAAAWMQQRGWLNAAQQESVLPALLFVGAVVAGIVTALLTEWVQRLGRVESSAALGVVFTCLFALGLLLLRLSADDVHIDADCVLFGLLVNSGLERGIPRAALMNGGVLAANLLLLAVFYKELKVAAFDPGQATSLGINARLVHYALMAATAVSVVAAFQSVGSILVIALLVVPPSTALLLAGRLHRVILLSLVVAALSAMGGHVAARALPGVLFGALGFPGVRGADPAGMMAACAGGLFLAALFLAPRQGLLALAAGRIRMRVRIAADDVIGRLYKLEEATGTRSAANLAGAVDSGLTARLASWELRLRGLIAQSDGQWRLTDKGRDSARPLVRGHRLWETYVQRHFALPPDHLHEAADRVEHFIDQELRERLAAELDSPATDPHGREIPDDREGTSPPGDVHET